MAELRPADLGDLGAICALEDAAFDARERWSRTAWQGELAADNRVVIVAGSPALGVITIQTVGGVADLNRVIVAEQARGRGLGRTLTEAGIAAARERECEEMLLEVRHDNTPALGLYAALGFAEIARRANYYGPGADALILRLDLADDEGDDHE